MNNKENKNFHSVPLRLIELCSGIGSQLKGLNNTGLFAVESVATSDLDKEVVVSYAAIHCGLNTEMIKNYEKYPSKEEMIRELSEKRIGYDFKKDKPYDWGKLAKKKDITKGIEKYWLADHISHNLGDMTQIKELPDCDFLTYSCPCTDLSISGKQAGLYWTCNDCGEKYNPSDYSVDDRYTCPVCGSHSIKSTRSGLLYEVERLLVRAKENNNLPSYLLLENVDALVSKKYIESFNDWINRLSDLGYNSYYKVINAKDCGIAQNRNRIFVISILKDKDLGRYTFPLPFDNGLRLRDYLEDDEDVLEKYFLSDEIQSRLLDSEKFTDNELHHVANLCSERFQKIHEQCRRLYDENGVSPTIPTPSGGNHEPKISRNQLKIARKLTPLECHRLMGFDDSDYYNCKEVGMSDTQGYKQTGNSIVVNCIELLAEHLYKAQYDESYICTDENFTQPQVD